MAKLSSVDQTLLAAVGHQVIQRMHEHSPRQLANVAWSFGTTRHLEKSCLAAMAPLLQNQLRELQFELQSTLWAWARLQLRKEMLFQATCDCARETALDFAPKNLAGIGT